MKKLLLLGACSIFAASIAFGNNLQFTNVSYNSGSNQLSVDVSWDNSWRNNEYYDAVWIFVKASPTGNIWQHQHLQGFGASTSLPLQLDFFNSTGAMLRRSLAGTGDNASTTVTLQLAAFSGPVPDFKVFGIEMVHVEQGDFQLGDGVNNNRFGQGDDITQPFLITSENAITTGTTSGTIRCPAFHACVGTIPAAYPKGWAPFYIMKYEITQEQYMEFLNCLTRTQQDSRTETDLSGSTTTNVYVMSASNTVDNNCGVRCNTNLGGTILPVNFYCDYNGNGIPNEPDDGQNIAMNYLNGQDVIAYLDWAALRPMTEMEYEKACRGPLPAISNEYAWGSSQTTIFGLNSISNFGTANAAIVVEGHGPIYAGTIAPVRVGVAATDTSTRATSGASYYGAMEMGSNVTEVLVYSTPANFAIYTGTLGNGELATDGNADVSDWVLDLYTLHPNIQYVSWHNTTYTTDSRTSQSGGRGVY